MDQTHGSDSWIRLMDQTHLAPPKTGATLGKDSRHDDHAHHHLLMVTRHAGEVHDVADHPQDQYAHQGIHRTAFTARETRAANDDRGNHGQLVAYADSRRTDPGT